MTSISSPKVCPVAEASLPQGAPEDPSCAARASPARQAKQSERRANQRRLGETHVPFTESVPAFHAPLHRYGVPPRGGFASILVALRCRANAPPRAPKTEAANDATTTIQALPLSSSSSSSSTRCSSFESRSRSVESMSRTSSALVRSSSLATSTRNSSTSSRRRADVESARQHSCGTSVCASRPPATMTPHKPDEHSRRRRQREANTLEPRI